MPLTEKVERVTTSHGRDRSSHRRHHIPVLTISRFALFAVALLGLAACGEGSNPVFPDARRSAVLTARQGDLVSAPLTGTLPDGVMA